MNFQCYHLCRLLLVISLVQWVSYVNCFTRCGYRPPRRNELVIGIEDGPYFGLLRASSRKPTSLRIKFHYMDSFNAQSTAKDMKKLILEPARMKIQSLLTAKHPIHGSLKVDRSCVNNYYKIGENGVRQCAYGCNPVTKCLDVQIPEQLLKKCNSNGNVEEESPGAIDTDIVLLVTYESCGGLTLAYAASCFSDKFDRPILGIINLCEGRITSHRNILESQKLVQHEIIHALGFSVDKYAFYRYEDGSPIVPRNRFGFPNLGYDNKEDVYKWNDQIIRTVKRKRSSIHGKYEKEMKTFVLPTLLKVAREHFNCPYIDGVDLEDFGSYGSVATHFDEYFLHNEIMTPETNYAIDTLSKFTLALLKDTGWYDVNFTNVDELDYGRNKGCKMPLEGCYSFMQYQKSINASLSPFCDRIFRYGNMASCSENRKYFDYCYLTRYTKLNKENQYFKTLSGISDLEAKYFAGDSQYNELCPSKVVFTNPNSVCSDKTNIGMFNRRNIVPSYFGPDSLCFDTPLNYDPGKVFHGASCQRYTKNETSKNITVYVGDQQFSCPSNKIHQYDTNLFYRVNLICPTNLDVFFPTKSATNKPYQFGVTIIFVLIILRFLTF